MSNELMVAEEVTTRKITKEEYEELFDRKLYPDFKSDFSRRYKIITEKSDNALYEYNIESRIPLSPKQLIQLTKVKQDKEYWIEHTDRYLENLKIQFDRNECYFITAEGVTCFDSWYVEYYDPKQDLCGLDPRVNEIRHNRRPY